MIEDRCNSILIVDDDADIRSALYDVLAEEGFPRVALAADGIEALAIVDKLVRPVLILVDLVMPKISGFEFIREVEKRGHELAHIVVITAMSRTVDGVRVLRKPFDLDNLIRLAHEACD